MTDAPRDEVDASRERDAAPGADATGAGPRREFERRREERRARASWLARRGRQLSRARLSCFGVFALLLTLAGVELLSPWWTLAPVIAFVALVVHHESIARQQALAGRAVEYHDDALARLDGAWPGRGVTRSDFVGDDHPFAVDLDVFGAGSLFDRVCTARTQAGERALAAWLSAPADVPTIRRRQRAVEELRGRLELREALALLGHELRTSVDVERLLQWAERPPAFASAGARSRASALAWALGLAAVAALASWSLSTIGLYLLLGVLLVEGLCYRARQQQFDGITRGVDGLTRDLATLAKVLARLEAERFDSELLRGLQTSLTGASASRRASAEPATPTGARQIAALARIVDWLEARRSGLFAPIAFALMWTWHFGLALERWRGRSGPEVRRWIEGLGELEALIALAGYAYENPDDPFPELVEPQGDAAPLLALEDGGHPLLQPGECVTNSVRLGQPTRVMIVSGSNMSGKSTLLRTVGTNVVLALAGAPVRARSMRLSPLRVGASLRVEDSLLGGRSRFYAGILRLRDIVALARGPVPALFLLDEILHGTNSHDRRIGAEAIVRGLVDAGAIGLVTTHDLALARVADALGERAVNVHFADELVDDELRFDYRMRPGVVDRSNALALMRAVGLEV